MINSGHHNYYYGNARRVAIIVRVPLIRGGVLRLGYLRSLAVNQQVHMLLHAHWVFIHEEEE